VRGKEIRIRECRRKAEPEFLNNQALFERRITGPRHHEKHPRTRKTEKDNETLEHSRDLGKGVLRPIRQASLQSKPTATKCGQANWELIRDAELH